MKDPTSQTGLLGPPQLPSRGAGQKHVRKDMEAKRGWGHLGGGSSKWWKQEGSQP